MRSADGTSASAMVASPTGGATAAFATSPEARSPWWRVAGPPALLMMAVLALTASRYGFHGDELYFRALPLAWWYDDQPPLTVWAAHLAASVSDGAAAQRLPAIVAAGLGVVVASRFPSLAGYDSRVQRVAAWAHAFTVYPLLMGHVMLTASLSLLVWQLVLLGVVAALTGHRHALAWAGVAAGVGCWNKLLVLVLVTAVFIALLVQARWVLRTVDAWLGAAAVVVIGGFQAAAQLTHGLPMLAVSGDLVHRNGTANRFLVLPLLAVFLGPPFLVVWWRGLMWRPRPRATDGPTRTGPVLAVVGAVLIAFTLVSPAQPYYAVGAFVPALALGWGRAADEGADAWRLAPRVIAANAVVSALLCLPLIPASSPAFTVVAALNPMARDQVGWPQYAQEMATARGSGRAVVTDSYALAGALIQDGPTNGVARDDVASSHNAFWSLGPPSRTAVLLVGRSVPAWRSRFTSCQDAGRLHVDGADPFGIEGTPMMRCAAPRGGWATAWPHLRRLGG